MKDEEHKIIFRFSFGYLMQLGDEAVSLIDRDTVELAPYGVDAAKRTEIATKTQELKDIPTDEELLGLVGIKTEAKDLKADELMVFIRDVMVRVRNAFGEESRIYRRYAVGSMALMRDNDLFKCARRVSRMSTEYITELTPYGVTPAMLTALDALAVEFDLTIDDKEDAIRERDIATQERVKLANALYSLIAEVYDYGKTYWYTRDEAKYNDYIIYDAAAPVVGKISSVSEATDNLNFEVSMVGKYNATAQVKISDGAVRKMIFDGVTLITFNHTFTAPGNYSTDVTGDLIDVVEYHSNNSSLTTFDIPDDAVNIHTYSLQGNKYNTPTVDGILMRINSFGTVGKLVNLAFNGVPSAVGLAAKASLESRGWTVIVAT